MEHDVVYCYATGEGILEYVFDFMLGSAEDVDAERVVAALGYGAGFAVGQSHDGKEGAENFR